MFSDIYIKNNTDGTMIDKLVTAIAGQSGPTCDISDKLQRRGDAI
jgi:hypothetical protein